MDRDYCANDADALALMVEWCKFRLPTWNVIHKVMPGRVIVDGRNIRNRAELEELGYIYNRTGEGNKNMMFNFEYIILIIFLLFLFCVEKKRSISDDYILTTQKLLCIVSFIFFWGLRGFIGTDYSWYYPYFNNLSSNLADAFFDIERIEPGYVIYVYIIKHIFDDYHFFIFVSTCLDVLFLHYIFKNLLRKNYILGYIIFIAFAANMEFNNLRNIRAILLFFVSIPYIIDRKLLKFCAFNLLGLTFHSTAIFFFPLYFTVNRNWSKILFPIVLIGFVLVVLKINVLTILILKLGGMLGGMYESSAELFIGAAVGEENGFTLGALVRLILGMFIAFTYNKISSPIYRTYANLSVCYLFCFSFLNEIPVFRLRFSMMFVLSLSVVVPYVYTLLKPKLRLIYMVFAFVAVLSQALVNFQGMLFRYDNLLFGIENYDERVNNSRLR